MTKDGANTAFIRYWQLIVVILTLAVSYGSMQSNINAMADDLKEEKQKSEEAEDDRASVKLSVVSIEKDVEYIKREIDKQDKKLDRILEKLTEK